MSNIEMTSDDFGEVAVSQMSGDCGRAVSPNVVTHLAALRSIPSKVRLYQKISDIGPYLLALFETKCLYTRLAVWLVS